MSGLSHLNGWLHIKRQLVLLGNKKRLTEVSLLVAQNMINWIAYSYHWVNLDSGHVQPTPEFRDQAQVLAS